MGHLRLEKGGLRCLAVAESFAAHSRRSVLAGVVMGGSHTIDGFVIGGATISGDDATPEILGMYGRLGRPDINCLLVSGVIISMYNIVDIREIHESLRIPVIGVTRGESGGIAGVIGGRFPGESGQKMRRYGRLGRREKIRLHTTHEVYVRCAGCTTAEAGRLLDRITIQGAMPEPLRVARLLARALRLGG